MIADITKQFAKQFIAKHGWHFQGVANDKALVWGWVISITISTFYSFYNIENAYFGLSSLGRSNTKIWLCNTLQNGCKNTGRKCSIQTTCGTFPKVSRWQRRIFGPLMLHNFLLWKEFSVIVLSKLKLQSVIAMFWPCKMWYCPVNLSCYKLANSSLLH